MKKSELRQLIREEIQQLKEGLLDNVTRRWLFRIVEDIKKYETPRRGMMKIYFKDGSVGNLNGKGRTYSYEGDGNTTAAYLDQFVNNNEEVDISSIMGFIESNV